MAGILALALAYVLSQFFRSFLAVLAPDLVAELAVTEAQLSSAAGIWFIAFALMQFPVGWSLDRFGPRRTAAALLVVAALGALLFALAQGATAITIAMALIGAGCSAVLMATLYIFARDFAPHRFAMFSSWFVAFGLAGNVLGTAPLAVAAEALGWRAVLGVLAGTTLLSAASVLVLVRDPPAADGAAKGPSLGGLVEILRTPMFWPLMAMAAVAYAPSANIRGLWAGPFLAEIYGMDTVAIGEATFFMALALIAGSIVYGPLDVVFRTRKWVPFTGSLVTALCVVSLGLLGPGSSLAAIALLTATAFFGSNYSLIMAHSRSFMPPHLIGRGMTLMNFFSIGGAGLVQFISGWVYSAASSGGDPEAAYRTLFSFYAVLLLLGLAAYLFSRDSNPRAGA